MISLYHQAVLIQSVIQGGAAVPDLVNETFEGAGTPTNWTSVANFDYSAAPLAGAQSCYIALPDYAALDLLSDYSEIWIKFLYRLPVMPASSIYAINGLDQAFTNNDIALFIFADGTATMDFATYSAVGSFAAATTYYVWIHRKVSVVSEFWWSTTDNRSTAPNHLTMSGSAISNGRISWTTNGSGIDAILDNVQIATFDFS